MTAYERIKARVAKMDPAQLAEYRRKRVEYQTRYQQTDKGKATSRRSYERKKSIESQPS